MDIQKEQQNSLFARWINRENSIFKSWASKITPGVRGHIKVAGETTLNAARIFILSVAQSGLWPW